MVKKSPSPAVVKSVIAATAPVVVAPVVVSERGPKKFTAEQYLTEYLAEQLAGGTWSSLCERTGFSLNNVRQAITTLRSDYRATMTDKANSSPDFLKTLSKVGEDVEVWADKKAELKFPFLQEGSRNTQKAKMRKSWEAEELSL